ncbi:unnamed protein product [Cuscuta campestris]|uniref:Reverse transcriptase domain-containing protein n=1 Tax=Cuscuta campestris TaxID=132261 RepID=A0A484KEZ1_9ASTE|nr:unnamed protein product [Cuscuta campestris]
MLDATTSSKSRPAARFCVELDVTKELLAKFFLDNGGKGLWQQVTYEQLPQYCIDCHKSSHTARECAKAKGKTPIPLAKPPTTTPQTACRARWRKQHIHSILNKHGNLISNEKETPFPRRDQKCSLAIGPKQLCWPMLECMSSTLSVLLSVDSQTHNPSTKHHLLARELIHLIDRKTEGGNLALKLDITKAFDTISWDYISQCLLRFGFNQNFTTLVMNSIQHGVISTLVNGSPSKPFNPRRGVRQGDPLSLYIFIIAMEGLTRSLNKLVSTGHLKGFNTGRIQTVNHLSYADDVLIFTNGSLHNLKKLKTFLNSFEESTGLHLNLTKSQIILPKPSSNHAKRQKDCLGMKVASLPVTYLGTPIYKGINRLKHCQDLLHKIDNKLSSWKMHTLSQAGRLTLIKYVLSTLPLHTMSSSKLPEGVLTLIECKLCHFFWAKTDDNVNHAWISWKKICMPTTEGGLGIPNLHTLQQSLGCKLWSKYHFTFSPWVTFLKQSYHRTGNFTTTLIDSPIWKRICQANDFCVANSTINNGCLEWDIGDNVSFSLKEVTAKLHNPEPSLLTASIPWPKKSIPKASLFLWRTLNGATPYANNLEKLGYNLPSMCLMCEHALETDLHCLIQCPKASTIWNTLGEMLHMPEITHSSFQHNLIMWWLSSTPADPLFHLKQNIPSIITWELWKTYNRIKFDNGHFLLGKTLEIIKHTLNAWSFARKGIPMPQTLRRIPSKPYKLVRWIPPNRYQYKLNVDGSMTSNNCGGGAILRDHQGNFLHAIAFPLPFTSPTTTETLAMAQALSIYTLQNMIVETDSMELINNVRGSTNSNALTSIRFSLQASNHHLTHTLREANGAADLLQSSAQLACNFVGCLPPEDSDGLFLCEGVFKISNAMIPGAICFCGLLFLAEAGLTIIPGWLVVIVEVDDVDSFVMNAVQSLPGWRVNKFGGVVEAVRVSVMHEVCPKRVIVQITPPHFETISHL